MNLVSKLSFTLHSQVFIDSPLKIPSTDGSDQGLGWWFSRADDSFDAREPSDFLSGFEASVSVVKDALRTQGPFDGILAFSQGAAFVTLLQILMEQHPEGREAIDYRFFCIQNGTLPR